MASEDEAKARKQLGRASVERAFPRGPRRPLDGAMQLGAGLLAGALAARAPLEIAVGLAGLAALARWAGRLTVVGAAAAALGLAVGACRAAVSVERFEAARREADRALPQSSRCSAAALVDSSPVRIRESMRWDARVLRLACEGGEIDWAGRVTLYGGPPDLARGDRVEVVATLAAPERLWNLATGDPRPAQAHRDVVRSGGTLDVRVVRRGTGIWAAIDRARAAIRGRIDATFPSELDAMARALVLGESDLSLADDRCFRQSGLSHLLAVSGMHLILVIGLFVRSAESALVRIEALAARIDVGRIVAGAGVPLAWIYAELAGAGGSTFRAAWMMTAAMLARATGRRADPTRAFGLSIVAMALADPLVTFDVSFALSAGATAGLIAFARPLGDALCRRLPDRAAAIGQAVATTAGASLPCMPMLARFAPTVPLGGVVANLLAVPVGECAALPLCLVHAVTAGWPAAERGCAATASGALVLVRLVARWASIPALTVEVPPPTSWQMVILALALCAVALRVPAMWPSLGAAAVAFVLFEISARRAGAPHGVLRATFLDVGQGDSAIVDLPDGQALVIDGGGLVGSPIDVGERVLSPELRMRRRASVAAAVLTHPHPDHFGGLLQGLAAVRVGALWDTGEGELEGAAGGYADLLAAVRSRGIEVIHPDRLCGEHRLGGAVVEVLAPCPTFSSDRGPNDNSFVLRIAYGERAILFVGDAEGEEERSLLSGATRLRLRADVLKVGHHGSRTSSSPEFLSAVAPALAVISVGRRNRFGHPSAVTLAALRSAGTKVRRTDRDGAVVVTTDGRSLDVSAAAPPSLD